MTAADLILLLKDPEVVRQAANLLQEPEILRSLGKIAQDPAVAQAVAEVLHDSVVVGIIGGYMRTAMLWALIPLGIGLLMLLGILYNTLLLRRLRRE